MSKSFKEIREEMERLSKKQDPAPLGKKLPIAKEKNPLTQKSTSSSWIPSSNSQTSIAKTNEDKNQSAASAAEKQYNSDAAMSEGGLGIVSNRLRKEAIKERELKQALQLETDAKYAQELQREEEARGVKMHLPNNSSEEADAQAARKLAEEWDAQEREERRKNSHTENDEALALKLQQEEEERVRPRSPSSPNRQKI